MYTYMGFFVYYTNTFRRRSLPDLRFGPSSDSTGCACMCICIDICIYACVYSCTFPDVRTIYIYIHI